MIAIDTENFRDKLLVPKDEKKNTFSLEFCSSGSIENFSMGRVANIIKLSHLFYISRIHQIGYTLYLC